MTIVRAAQGCPHINIFQHRSLRKMNDSRLDVLKPVFATSGLDCIALVPGANFRKIFGTSFHQNERPLVILAGSNGTQAAIVPNLEMASFAAIGFKGEVYDWRDETGYQEAFAAAARHFSGIRTLGVEGQSMRFFVSKALEASLPGATIMDAHVAISAIRILKSAAEIEAMRKAISISQEALEATLGEVRVGMSEKAIEGILLRHLFGLGSHGLAFNPIVAAGDNSAKPHAKARSNYEIKRGDMLLMDFGGAYDGYCADITRTFFVGEARQPDLDFYNCVLSANETGRGHCKPGASAHDVDDAVQNFLEASAYSKFRRHKTGHGLGLEVHEDPYIMRGNQQLLEPGMVFTVEPGLYRLGEAGVRIEDDMLITHAGATSLTTFPREPRIVG